MSTVDDKGQKVRDCTDPEHGDHYWRRSIFGGHPQAERLVAAGLGYWPMCERPPLPEIEGAEYAKYDDDLDECPPLNDAAREELRAQEAYLKATYNEAPGISVYKLCGSNDGWWVTQTECKTALELWEKNGRPDVDEGYGDTIPFLRAGAAHSGFRVW